MKTVTLNAYVIISMLISLLAFYSGMLPAGTNPKLIMWFAGAGSFLSIILKVFFPSGTWTGKGASTLFWVVNGGVFLSAVLTSWGGIGLVSATVVTAVVGTVNVLLSYIGVTPNRA